MQFGHGVFRILYTTLFTICNDLRCRSKRLHLTWCISNSLRRVAVCMLLICWRPTTTLSNCSYILIELALISTSIQSEVRLRALGPRPNLSLTLPVATLMGTLKMHDDEVMRWWWWWWWYCTSRLRRNTPYPALGLIWTVMLVWRKGNINRIVSVYCVAFQQCTLHNHNDQFFQVGLLDRALISIIQAPLYLRTLWCYVSVQKLYLGYFTYLVEGLAWWDWPFTWWTDQLLSFSAWHCWLGHLARKNRPRYDP